MHTVQLKLDDSIYDNVMFLLNNLNLNLKGMEIKEIESLDLKQGFLDRPVVNEYVEDLKKDTFRVK